jgi:geranylgeranyl pyrophosphate synthase
MNDIIEFLEKKRPLIDSCIIKYLPKKIDKKYLEWVFGKPSYSYNVNALQKALSEPIWDFLERGGKRWRPALFLLITEALGGDVEKVKDFVVLTELLHEGSIMIDDIEDNSDLRRGKPCTHKIYGIDVAINAGNFMYFLPFISLIKNRDKFDKNTIIRAYDAIIEELIKIHAGQGMDIIWHKGLADADSITEKDYLQMCAYKTGVLPRLAARLAVIFSGGSKKAEEKLGKLGEAIGLIFQIKDDILNIKPTEKWGKELGDDISEGKRTLLVIHTFKKANRKDRERLLKILKMHTKDKKLIIEAINIIKKYGSIEYAERFAEKLLKKAWKDVDKLLKPSPAKEKLKAFVDFAIRRDV